MCVCVCILPTYLWRSVKKHKSTSSCYRRTDGEEKESRGGETGACVALPCSDSPPSPLRLPSPAHFGVFCQSVSWCGGVSTVKLKHCHNGGAVAHRHRFLCGPPHRRRPWLAPRTNGCSAEHRNMSSAHHQTWALHMHFLFQIYDRYYINTEDEMFSIHVKPFTVVFWFSDKLCWENLGVNQIQIDELQPDDHEVKISRSSLQKPNMTPNRNRSYSVPSFMTGVRF